MSHSGIVSLKKCGRILVSAFRGGGEALQVASLIFSLGPRNLASSPVRRSSSRFAIVVWG